MSSTGRSTEVRGSELAPKETGNEGETDDVETTSEAETEIEVKTGGNQPYLNRYTGNRHATILRKRFFVSLYHSVLKLYTDLLIKQ